MTEQKGLGRKIRRLRKERGLTQVALAERAGISGSYLNLIEHERRSVTAPLLIRLATALDVELAAFTGDEEARLIADLGEVFGDPVFHDQELGEEELRDLASSSPAACRALKRLYHAFQGSRQDAQALAERLSADDELLGQAVARTPSEEVSDFLQAHRNHFPELESAAEQLWSDAGLDSGDLAARLVEHLRRAEGVEVEFASSDDPVRAVRRFLPDERRLVLSEVLAPRSRNFQLAHQIALIGLRPLLDRHVAKGRLSGPDSEALCRVALANYFAGAVLMPYEPFLEAARSMRYDVERLGHRFRTSFEQVCHRLTTLQRAGASGVPFHMVRVDIAGNISKRFSASGIGFARYSGTCPKWNVHAAFMTPGFIRTQVSVMPDGAAFFSIARTIRKERGGYEVTPIRFAIELGCAAAHASELTYADGVDLHAVEAAVEVGVSCRLCERTDCAQRAFPALHQRMNIDENARALSFYAAADEEGAA